MFFELVEIFHSFMGSGLIVLIFLLCEIYLFFFEKRKERRIFFVYFPLIVLVLFFNPLFSDLVLHFLDAAVYYRFLWLLPLTFVIAYTAAEVYGKLSGRKKYIAAGAGIILILISGKLVYTSPYFDVAKNPYHMPESVVKVCDAIRYEGREIMAVFPTEMIPFVRQYEGTICMPYGREVLMETTFWSPLYYMMELAEEVSADEFAAEARERQCVYIVVREKKKITGSMEACDFEKYAVLDGYVVYRDTRVTLGY